MNKEYIEAKKRLGWIIDERGVVNKNTAIEVITIYQTVKLTKNERIKLLKEFKEFII